MKNKQKNKQSIILIIDYFGASFETVSERSSRRFSRRSPSSGPRVGASSSAVGAEEDLQETPDSLDKLKFILSIISKILSVSMDMELRMQALLALEVGLWSSEQDVRERYRTLELYNCQYDVQVTGFVGRQSCVARSTRMRRPYRRCGAC